MDETTINSISLTTEQVGYLYDILVDHQAMIHGAQAFGENAKQELERLINAAEDDESKKKAEEGLAALERDQEFIKIAETRFLDIYNIVIPYAKEIGVRGTEELWTDTDESLHPVGEETEDVSPEQAD